MHLSIHLASQPPQSASQLDNQPGSQLVPKLASQAAADFLPVNL